MESFDVIIVGAGISGIGAAVHLQTHCPGKTFAVLEGRDAIGGTWDLFRYPGVRSDSDMHTLGYNFKPWKRPRAIADGPTILAYVQEAAEEYGIVPHIRFKHLVRRLSWSSVDALWTVEADYEGRAVSFTARHVMLCAGYYRYSTGYTPEFAGVSRFKGALIHPQFWPEDLGYAGKRVIVIGSGATAITLVPAMTDKAAHVTMLQRSPTYVISVPATDGIAERLLRVFPKKAAYAIARWKNVLVSLFFYQLCRRWPEAGKKMIREGALRSLPEGYPVDVHFKPRYNPWDQRLCVIPDGDLFRSIRKHKVSIVTDRID